MKAKNGAFLVDQDRSGARLTHPILIQSLEIRLPPLPSVHQRLHRPFRLLCHPLVHLLDHRPDHPLVHRPDHRPDRRPVRQPVRRPLHRPLHPRCRRFKPLKTHPLTRIQLELIRQLLIQKATTLHRGATKKKTSSSRYSSVFYNPCDLTAGTYHHGKCQNRPNRGPSKYFHHMLTGASRLPNARI